MLMAERLALAWMDGEYSLMLNLLRELDTPRAFRMGVRVYTMIEAQWGNGADFLKWLEENI
jgi:hypothetical protein